MRVEDMIIVSVDDHIVEPPNTFQDMPGKYRDRAPKFLEEGTGAYWLFGNRKMPNVAMNAVAGRAREELGFEPTSLSQVRKGVYDVDARVDDMNVNGTLASLCFGSMSGFAGETWLNEPDRDVGLACLQYYNDWHVDSWCNRHPGRFIPLGQVPLWDADLAAKEVLRLAKKGVTAITFTGLPPHLGLPSIHTGYWDPLIQACDENNITICVHINGAGGSDHIGPDSPVDAWLTKPGLSTFSTAAEWLWSTALRRFPNVKIMLSEGGIGWIPYFMERLDLVAKNHGPWTHNTDFGGLTPSEFFKTRFYSCFIEDKTGLKYRKDVGIDMITFENDYPHADVTWPNSADELFRDLMDAECTDEEINKITHLNAIKALNYDPIKVIGDRSKCTVGALRAQAGHVDIRPLREVGGTPAAKGKSVPTAADVARQRSAQLV